MVFIREEIGIVDNSIVSMVINFLFNGYIIFRFFFWYNRLGMIISGLTIEIFVFMSLFEDEVSFFVKLLNVNLVKNNMVFFVY